VTSIAVDSAVVVPASPSEQTLSDQDHAEFASALDKASGEPDPAGLASTEAGAEVPLATDDIGVSPHEEIQDEKAVMLDLAVVRIQTQTRAPAGIETAIEEPVQHGSVAMPLQAEPGADGDQAAAPPEVGDSPAPVASDAADLPMREVGGIEQKLDADRASPPSESDPRRDPSLISVGGAIVSDVAPESAPRQVPGDGEGDRTVLGDDPTGITSTDSAMLAPAATPKSAGTDEQRRETDSDLSSDPDAVSPDAASPAAVPVTALNMGLPLVADGSPDPVEASVVGHDDLPIDGPPPGNQAMPIDEEGPLPEGRVSEVSQPALVVPAPVAAEIKVAQVATTSAPEVSPQAPHQLVMTPEVSPSQQLAGAIRQIRKLTDGTQRLSLELRPRELGTVNLEVAYRNGQLHLHAVAETAGARTTLEQAMPALRIELDNLGLQAGNLQVSPDTREGADQRNPGRQGADRHRTFRLAASSKTPGRSAVPTTQSSHGGLDVRI